MASFRRNQLGDTIIEVLIALTIVGLSIGLAYSIASRSLRSARQSQERVEALKLVEGQIEQLKGISYSADKTIFTQTGLYCIDNGAIKSSPALDLADDDLTKYNANCVKNSLYHISVQTDVNNFNVVVRWNGIGSLNIEEIKSTYRLYPN